MKKIVVALTVSAGILGLSACSNGDSEAVVKTDAGTVTKDDFYKEMKDKTGDQVLQQMVMEKILDDKYDVDDQVDKQVKETKDQLGDNFKMALQQQGMKDEDDYKEQVRLSLLQQEAIAEDMDIKDSDLKERYKQMKKDIKAKHITVEDKKTAKKVKKKLDDGEDFAKIAKKYSKDDATKDDGGDLGFFNIADSSQQQQQQQQNPLDVKVKETAYKLDKGEVSDPIETKQGGFDIIKVTDKRDTKQDVGKYKDVKDDIRQAIISDNTDQQKAQQKMQKIMKDANIKVKDKQFKDLFDDGDDDSKDKK